MQFALLVFQGKEPGMDCGSAVVVGSGIMGRDIAAIFVNAGWTTQVVAPVAREWDDVARHVAQSVAQMGGEPRFGLLRLRHDLRDVDWTGVDIVIETVTEKLDVKREVFAELDVLVPAGIPIGSNSSGLRITDIAAGCQSAARMANAHFFLPAHLVPLVEVAKGAFTLDAVCVSVSRPCEQDVRQYIADKPGFGKLVVATLASGASQVSVLHGAHADRLADRLANHLKDLRSGLGGAERQRLHLFVSSPYTFAFFLGHHLKVLKPVTLYEFDFDGERGGGYAPSLSIPAPK